VVDGGVVVSLTSEFVFGVDARSGEEVWRVARSGGGVAPPAVADAEGGPLLLYTERAEAKNQGRAHGDLVAFDLSKRERAWSVALRTTSVSGVTVDGDRAFVGDEGGRLYAVDTATASKDRIAWTAGLGAAIDSPVAASDGRLFVTTSDPETGSVALFAVEESTGRILWNYAPRTAVGVASSPSVHGDLVYVGFGDLNARAFRVSDGTEEWSSRVRSYFSPLASPALTASAVYVASTSGSETGIYGLDPRTGARLWEGGAFELGTANLRSSPVVLGDSVVAGLEDGRLAAVDTATGDQIWQGSTGEGALGGSAVTGGVLVVAKDGRHPGLIAFAHDAAGHLKRVASPTRLEPGRMVADYGIALGAVGAGVLLLYFVLRAFRRRELPAGDEQ
jgi:outer membrane protein assembly factor BamB